MELAALIISIISFLGTACLAIIQLIQSKKLSKTSIESEFFSEIYKEHLVKKLPEARRLMWVDKDKKLKDDKALIDELNSIRQDSLYFMYNNNVFYEKLKNALQSLEDYLINSEDKEVDDSTFHTVVQDKLSLIYKIISDAKYGSK